MIRIRHLAAMLLPLFVSAPAWAGIGLGGGVLYGKINSKNVDSVYSDLGFTVPARMNTGVTGFVFNQFSSGFRLGFEGGTLVAETRKTDSTELAYGIGYGGLTLGWVSPLRRLTPTFEVFTGLAESALALETSSDSARISRYVLMARPTLGLELRTFSFARLGLKASLTTFPRSFRERIKGSAPDVNVTPGLTYNFRAELIFGSF